jgi:MFS family permease
MLKYWKGVGDLPRPVWVVSASTLVNRAGSMVLSFLVIYLTRERQLSAERAGFLLFLYGAGAIVAGPIAGRLADRWGSAPLMRASLFGSGVVLLLYPFAHTLPALVGVTVVLAMVTESFRPAAMSFFAETVEPKRRKSAFSVYRLAINLGMAIGPAVGGVLATISFRYLFLVDGATSILAGLVLAVATLPRRSHPAAVSSSAPAPTTASRLRLSTAAHADPRFLFFLASVLPVCIVFFQHMSTMPLFVVRDLGFSPRTFGLLFSLNCVLIVLLEVPLNAATSHWPHRRTLALGALLSGFGFGGMAFAHGLVSLAVTVVIWTFGEMLFFPASAAYATDIAPDARRGEYSGLYTMMFSVAFAIGPWAGTVVLERIGARSLWGITAVLGALAATMLLRMREPARHEEVEMPMIPETPGAIAPPPEPS